MIRAINSRRTRQAGNFVCVGNTRKAYKNFVGKFKGRDHLGDLDVEGKIVLKWIIKK
jgi:hypothetical protein